MWFEASLRGGVCLAKATGLREVRSVEWHWPGGSRVTIYRAGEPVMVLHLFDGAAGQPPVPFEPEAFAAALDALYRDTDVFRALLDELGPEGPRRPAFDDGEQKELFRAVESASVGWYGLALDRYQGGTLSHTCLGVLNVQDPVTFAYMVGRYIGATCPELDPEIRWEQVGQDCVVYWPELSVPG